MSSERLKRLDATLQKIIDDKEFPGVTVMIARKGKLVYQKSFGFQDREKATPMANDSIFRIYSMTKPIVSVAAMILVEEGKLHLAEPISKYIPEFKEMKVGVSIPSTRMELHRLRPFQRSAKSPFKICCVTRPD